MKFDLNAPATIAWLPSSIDPHGEDLDLLGLDPIDRHASEERLTLLDALFLWKAERGARPDKIGWIKTEGRILTQVEMIQADEQWKISG